MTETERIVIEVVYALPGQQKLLTLRVADGSTARETVLASGLNQFFPQLDLQHCPLGVFGRAVADTYRLQPGDRVEIYRPLINEPREARRAAAASGSTMGAKSATK